MIEIFVDGACSHVGNSGHGPGGWSVIVVDEYGETPLSGGHPDTTNNRMEMQAVIEGLNQLGTSLQKIVVYSDSAYICNCVNDGWYKKWVKNGWMSSARNPVENQDLWKQIIDLVNHYSPVFVKVKGHDKRNHQDPEMKRRSHYNDRCDQLAVAAVAKQKEEFR